MADLLVPMSEWLNAMFAHLVPVGIGSMGHALIRSGRIANGTSQQDNCFVCFSQFAAGA